MDKFYIYHIPKGCYPKTRYSLEKFVDILKEFFA